MEWPRALFTIQCPAPAATRPCGCLDRHRAVVGPERHEFAIDMQRADRFPWLVVTVLLGPISSEVATLPPLRFRLAPGAGRRA